MLGGEGGGGDKTLLKRVQHYHPDQVHNISRRGTMLAMRGKDMCKDGVFEAWSCSRRYVLSLCFWCLGSGVVFSCCTLDCCFLCLSSALRSVRPCVDLRQGCTVPIKLFGLVSLAWARAVENAVCP